MASDKGNFIRIDFSMLGDKELIKAFKKVEVSMQKRFLNKAFKKVAANIEESAKSKAPTKSFNLQRFIATFKIKRSRKWFGLVVATGSRNQHKIKSTDPFFYPAAQELGVKKRKVGRAQSYLRASADANRVSGMKIIQNEIKKGIDRLARKAAKAAIQKG